jgi:hypothetical protein
MRFVLLFATVLLADAINPGWTDFYTDLDGVIELIIFVAAIAAVMDLCEFFKKLRD